MAVKPGYKKSELGLIPPDWEVRKLPEICWFQEGPGLRSWQFKTSGLKVVNVTNLENGILNLELTERYISIEEFNLMYRHFAIDAADILMASSGNSYGKTAIVRSQDLPLLMNTSVIRFKPLKGCRYGFLTAFLNSPQFKQQIDLMITGGAQPNFGPYHLKRINVPFPPKPEQSVIADALGDVDGVLGGLDRLIAKKRDLKQAAMQQLITGQKRLPGFHEEWEERSFGELAVPRSERLDPSITGVVDYCVELEHIQPMTGKLLGWTSTAENSSLKTTFRTGDILFGKLRAYLRKYWLATMPGVCSTEIWVFGPNFRLVTSEYLFQLVRDDRFIETASAAYGTHMPRSDWNVVKNYEIRLPPIPEQAAIAEVLRDMDSEIAALEQRRDKTRVLKQAMMQELLTGKTRLM
jgi:type I restriction enzyme, S subunit